MPVVSKKQGKFMQAVANSPKFAKKVGVNQSVGQEYTKENSMKTKKMNMGGRAMKDRDGSVAMDPRMQMAMAAQQKRAAAGGMNKGGATMKARGKTMAGVKKMKAGGNTSRMNRTEELGRVDAERANTASGRRNLSAEKSRIRGELGMKKGGKVAGYKAGGMADKMGRALAKDNKGMSKAKLDDAGGRAMMKKGGATMKAKGKGVQGYKARLDDSLGARKGKKKQSMASRRNESKGAKKAAGKKAYSGNRKSAQGKASKRADGIAQRGRTRGRIV
jgi:hypothetical protein